MLKTFLFSLFVVCFFGVGAQQNNYRDSLQDFRENYVIKHEVVSGADKKLMRFYPINATYRAHAVFERISDSAELIMKTSGTKDKKYYRYGRLKFKLLGTRLQLTMYQSEELMQDSTYKNYLFVPFTDATSGGSSYGGGRYIDFEIGSIEANRLLIDFNKAYNPYCAYSTGYNCPIPPRENNLAIAVKAGEKAYQGTVKSRK